MEGAVEELTAVTVSICRVHFKIQFTSVCITSLCLHRKDVIHVEPFIYSTTVRMSALC